ncbi:MAG TPA: polyphosphate kinase 2 [Flammeovirgaceae bacterium]|nr:polyphosphate kinase 2 [Flammeovirgaceae bacterium]
MSKKPIRIERYVEKYQEYPVNEEILSEISTRRELIDYLKSKNIRYENVLDTLSYEKELRLLQIELVKMQQWVKKHRKRVAIIFEGRDASGKGGTIRRFVEHLNPRAMRVVALAKPTETEKGQWYFTRYIKELPNPGEVVFFDRSWYNRAVVEPVMGFCTKDQYQEFMRQVPEFEHMLYEDGVTLIKFWFSVSQKEQKKRFESRKTTFIKQWKISPVDEKATEMWDKYTFYKEAMFSRTHTTYAPWVIVRSNNKKRARLESMRYVLSTLEYDGKEEAGTLINPDPTIVSRFFRSIKRLD